MRHSLLVGSADNYSLNGEVAVTCLKNAISYFSDHTDYLKNVAAMIFPLLLFLPQVMANFIFSICFSDRKYANKPPYVPSLHGCNCD